MRHRSALLAVVLSLGIAAAARAQSSDPVAALIDRWASTFNAGDFEGAAALYTADAVRFPPDAQPLRGRDAIEADMRTYAGLKIDLTLTGSKMGSDTGAAWGTYALSGQTADGDSVSQSGPWMNVMVKEKDGTWRIYRDIWNIAGSGDAP